MITVQIIGSVELSQKIFQIVENETSIKIVEKPEINNHFVEQVLKWKPDVIIMSIDLGDEISAIITAHSCSIIVVTTKKTKASEISQAMNAGALVSLSDVDLEIKNKKNIVHTIIAAARMKSSRSRFIKKNSIRKNKKQYHDYNVIALGASTGCPRVLSEIFSNIPVNFHLPILLVVHLPKVKGLSFSNWLSGYCRLKVLFAENDLLLREMAGKIVIAPPDKHMVVVRERIMLLDTDPVNFCRPSIDVLFYSLAKINKIKPVALLLTGMGEDGAKGLKAIKDAGGFTICQDEKTSVVFGMPQAAIKLNAVDQILPCGKMAKKIIELASTEPKKEKGEKQ